MHPNMRQFTFVALAALLLLLLAFAPHAQALDAGEIEALKDMQAEWGRQLGWTGVPSCSWTGVVCNDAGHVVQLYLWNNQLSGSIPDSIGNLQSLQNLYLQNNTLTGLVPSWICKLQNYDLEDNQFSCPLPSCCTVGCGSCSDVPPPPATGTAVNCCLYANATTHHANGLQCAAGGGCREISGSNLIVRRQASSCEQCFDRLPTPVAQFDCCVYSNSTTHALETPQCAPRGGCIQSADLKAVRPVSDCSQCSTMRKRQ